MWKDPGFTRLLGTEYGKGGTVMKIEPQARLIRCPECESGNVIRKGKVKRRLRASQVGHNKMVSFEIDVPVVQRRDCGAKRQIDLEIAEPRKSYTKAFARDTVELLRSMSVLAVARFLGVSWGLANSILRKYLEKRYPKKNYKKLKASAIDETSVGKGHKYITIVHDLVAGVPIFVAEGKSESSLDGFWELVGEKALKKIECVAMDMGGPTWRPSRSTSPKPSWSSTASMS
jgi:transposase